MDLLQIYEDRNDDEIDKLEDQFQDPNSTASSPEASPPRLLPAKFAAPKVDETMLALMVAQAYQAQSRPIDPLQHVVAFNPTYEQLWAPIVGPAHSYTKDGIAQGMRNHKLGFVEDTSIEPFIFDEQYYTFHKYGYALTPLPPLAIIMSVILMPCKRMMPSLSTTSDSTSRRRGRLKRRKQRRRKVMATKKTTIRLSFRIQPVKLG